MQRQDKKGLALSCTDNYNNDIAEVEKVPFR